MTFDKIKARVDARKLLATAFELALEEYLAQQNGSEAEGLEPLTFWQVAKELAESKLPKQSPAATHPPMTYQEAREFGSEEMEFGKYLGLPIDQVPIEYLVWLADEKDGFKKQLRRYLQSPRIAAEVAALE